MKSTHADGSDAGERSGRNRKMRLSRKPQPPVVPPIDTPVPEGETFDGGDKDPGIFGRPRPKDEESPGFGRLYQNFNAIVKGRKPRT